MALNEKERPVCVTAPPNHVKLFCKHASAEGIN